ncbi:MAG: NifX-associated nitrogen fixation protein [Rhodospirillales bacterium]|nr:NifX-associated nitrogen fixation protein [Rhodospirillales bacterium]
MDGTNRAVTESAFVADLLRLIRAEDRFGAWDKKSDEQLLAAYIVTKEQRKQLPMCSDPDPDLLDRLQLFYGAVGLGVEKRTRIMAQPMLKMSHEGWGRLVVLAGRLVVINKHMRDVHRWGFLSLEKLGEEGDRLVAEAVAMVQRFPEAAGL